ncbi:hypothetical protein EXIGLDRAFT_422955 [Exidia glandulosa HHB12029]|uniref:F-box domain-containing protein n=1 Tax=Exidia glandulosa HHB12029 TaxID=1314781 RepID=A0A165BDJ5_EXIGL|nr:hypothetical protein EXIGLDRAFT_422955 [Exidia glandulosa HHB12029]
MAPSIPTETFPSIFVYLSLFDLVRVSLVSRYWRSICLDTPSLWTGIETAGCKKSFLDAIAVRSGTLPLTIESNTNDLFCGSPLSMADALESVSEEHVMLVYLPRLMPRVKTLLLYDFNHTMGYILRHPAPVLEVLILSAGDGHLCDRAFRGQSGTSAPSFPALKKLALSSIAFFGSSQYVPDLKSWSSSSPTTSNFLRGRASYLDLSPPTLLVSERWCWSASQGKPGRTSRF